MSHHERLDEVSETITWLGTRDWSVYKYGILLPHNIRRCVVVNK